MSTMIPAIWIVEMVLLQNRIDVLSSSDSGLGVTSTSSANGTSVPTIIDFPSGVSVEYFDLS